MLDADTRQLWTSKAVRLQKLGDLVERRTVFLVELLKQPGEVTTHSEVGNQVLICSLTQPADAEAWARVRKEFGDVAVAIQDPDQLLADMRSALDQKDPWQRQVVPQLWPAVYDKVNSVPLRLAGSTTSGLSRTEVTPATSTALGRVRPPIHKDPPVSRRARMRTSNVNRQSQQV